MEEGACGGQKETGIGTISYIAVCCSDILRMDSTNADALYVRGLCLYYEDCIEKAVQFFVQALRMAPDHEKACLACRVSGGDGAAKSPGCGVFLNQTSGLVLLDQSLLPPSALLFPGLQEQAVCPALPKDNQLLPQIKPIS